MRACYQLPCNIARYGGVRKAGSYSSMQRLAPAAVTQHGSFFSLLLHHSVVNINNHRCVVLELLGYLIDTQTSVEAIMKLIIQLPPVFESQCDRRCSIAKAPHLLFLSVTGHCHLYVFCV